MAGVQDLGSTGRGNDMQIGMYVEKGASPFESSLCKVLEADHSLLLAVMDSEMSGNVVDLCPVGALTSKPYAFQSRPWELKKTESVDVLDGVGSNIRIDSRGVQVMRIQPRVNDSLNEEWINDKTRYAYDGLRFQRLTTPLVKRNGRFEPAGWADALEAIHYGLEKSGAQGNELVGVAGDLADAESMVALKDFLNRLGSENLTVDSPAGAKPPVHGVDFRANYLFNSTIAGLDEADAVLLVGTDPRHEGAIINTRLRRTYLKTPVEFGLVGPKVDLTYEYEHLGEGAADVVKFLGAKDAGKSAFAKAFAGAKKPLIIVGSGVAEQANGAAVYEAVAKFVDANKDRFLTPEWNGFSVLQRSASRSAAFDIGFTPSSEASRAKSKFIYLLNADEIDPKSIPKDAFVVYQGHHGDLGAQLADVCLPGSAYTEKAATWVNTEGRTQMGRTAVPPPGAAREDWKILRALSEVVHAPLPYEDAMQLRDRMWEISPTLCRYDTIEPASAELAQVGFASLAKQLKGSKADAAEKLALPVKNFYQTDVVSRSSVTMAQVRRRDRDFAVNRSRR